MNDTVKKLVEDFKEKAPDMVKNNKGALIGAAIGYIFLTNNSEEVKSTILGAVTGSLMVDKKKEDK